MTSKLLSAFNIAGRLRKCRDVFLISAKAASSKHPLQGLTDEYLNEPAKDDLTWSPSDPPPGSEATLAHTEPLAAWICSRGGYVNQHLSLGTSPTLGCRGVLIEEGLSGLAESEAVIMLPYELTMGTGTAAEGLSAALSNRSIADIASDPILLISLFLAMERRKGAGSFWRTYIQMLPRQVPCVWGMPKEAQSARLKAAGSQVSKGALRQAVKSRREKLEAACRAYAGPLKISANDLQWAYGMVESRCYTCPVEAEDGLRHEPVLLPYIDMCNHRSGGLQPGWGTQHSGAKVACLVHTAEIPVRGGELFTDYFVRPLSPLDRLLKYGFT